MRGHAASLTRPLRPTATRVRSKLSVAGAEPPSKAATRLSAPDSAFVTLAHKVRLRLRADRPTKPALSLAASRLVASLVLGVRRGEPGQRRAPLNLAHDPGLQPLLPRPCRGHFLDQIRPDPH